MAQIELQIVNGRLSGSVVAPEFTDLTHLDRQRRIWNQIRQDLSEDAAQIGFLVLYSPEEADAVAETED